MAYQFILFERSDGVGTVTLNRPDQLNALTPVMLQELSDVFRGMERDPQVRAILLTGAGRAFCGGEDFRQRAEAELKEPSSTPLPTPQVSSRPDQPAFESLAINFNDPFADSRSGSNYEPRPLPAQAGPQPQLTGEFNPVNSNPQPVEIGLSSLNFQPQPVENTRPGPVFKPENNSLPSTEAEASAATSSLAEEIRRAYNPLIRQMRSLEKPIIAAVNGVAAGTGLGLALACDIRYAAERARFVEVSVRVGLLPGGGTAFFLPRLIGLSRALEMAFQGEELLAPEAERLGLVSRVLPVDSLVDESRKLAMRLAKGPTRAIGLTKSLLYRSANLNLDQSLDLEAQLLQDATRSQDYKEGLRAFVEKRAPNYRGQ